MKMIWCVLVLLLAGCAEPVAPPPQAGNTHKLPEIEWRIRSQKELLLVYANSGEKLGDKDRLTGFVGKEGGRWVVYTIPPKTVDDEATCTLGHEIMHIALGPYHSTTSR